MSHDVRELLVDALSELIARDLDDETLEKLSGDELHWIADVALSQVVRIEGETGRSLDELLLEESELVEVLREIEESMAGEEMAQGGFEVPDGEWEYEDGA